MNKNSEPSFTLASLDSTDARYRDTAHSGDFDGIRIRRVLAYAVDIVCLFILGAVASVLASLMGVITFGLLSPVLAIGLAILPLAYHTATIGSEWHGTVGMRLFDLEVSLEDGTYPDYMTAFFHSALFYFTMAITSFLILVFSLFNSRGRLLHDFLTHSLVRRRRPAPAGLE